MSDLKGKTMSELVAMGTEISLSKGLEPVTSFKNLAAARAHITALENTVNTPQTESASADFDPTAVVDGTDVSPKADNAKYNSSALRGPTQGVGAYAKELIVAQPLATNKDIVEQVVARFPTAKTSPSCIAYYRTKLKAVKAPAVEAAAEGEAVANDGEAAVEEATV